MASKNREEQFSATPGARPNAVEEPLHVGPPDALIESQRTPSDIVPDMDTKGYHVGMVRQPVEPVSGGFVSEHPSKFAAAPTLREAQAYHNAVEQSDEWQAEVADVQPVLNEDDLKAAPPWARAQVEATRQIGPSQREVAPPKGSDDDSGELKGEALDEAGKAAGIEGWSEMKADEKRAALKAHQESGAQ